MYTALFPCIHLHTVTCNKDLYHASSRILVTNVYRLVYHEKMLQMLHSLAIAALVLPARVVESRGLSPGAEVKKSFEARAKRREHVV